MKTDPTKPKANAYSETSFSGTALRAQADAQHLAMMLQSAREWLADAFGDEVSIGLINDCISRLGPISRDMIGAKGQKITNMPALICMLIYIHEEIMTTVGDIASANILEELIRSLVKTRFDKIQAHHKATRDWLN